MGKNIKRAFALFLCLAMTLSTLPLQALAADNVTVAKNDFIQVTLNNKNGRFSVRTVDGQPVRKLDQDAPLTFDKDDTSFTTFRINGTEYIFGNKYSIDAKQVKSSMSYPKLIVSDDTGTQVISTTWSVEGVDVTQELTVFGNTKKTDTTQSGMVMLSYVVNNKSGASVSLGSRVLLDTMIGMNDGPSYQNGTISENTQTTERTLVRDLKTGQTVDGQDITEDNLNYYDLKAFFLMRDAGSSADPLSTNIFAYGYHNFTDSLNLVDKVVVGHWNHLANSKYEVEVDPTLDFTVDTNKYGTADSAVAYYWNDKTLSNGDARQFQVLYGLGEIIEENQAFNVTFPSPIDHLTANADKTELEDNGVFLVTVQAEVPLESETYHSMISCSFHLGNNLRFVKTENGKVYLDANGKPVKTGSSIETVTTAKSLTPAEIEKRDAEINATGSSNIGKYGPGDIATFQFYVMAEGKPWPAVRSYFVELTSPEIEDASGPSDTGDKSSAELINAMDGDPALAALMSVTRYGSILVPAIGEMSQSYAFSLTPEVAYYKDEKIVTVGVTNADAYDNSSQETYQVYLVNSLTGDKYQAPSNAISRTILDGKTGLLNFTYRGAQTVNNAAPGAYADTPELPEGAYYVQVVYSGSMDKEVNDMLSFTTTQTMNFSTDKDCMMRTGSIVTVAKRYKPIDNRYTTFITNFNAAAKETANLKQYRTSDAYQNGNSIYEKLEEGFTYTYGNYRPYYEAQIWRTQEELDAYKKEINVVEDQTKYDRDKKNPNDDVNWNHGEILLTIRGKAKEQDDAIIIDGTSPDLIINDVVRYGGKQKLAGIKDFKPVYKTIPGSDIRIQKSLFMDSVGDKLSEAIAKAGGLATGQRYNLGDDISDENAYCTLTVSADGGLYMRGYEDEQFYAGEWRIDFFDGFDKSLWTQLMDTFEERTAAEMVAKDPVYTMKSHCNGIVADQAIPCGIIWEEDVYFNMMSPSEHTVWCAGGMYDLTEFVLSEKNNEALLRTAGSFDAYIARVEAENLAYNKSDFWGQESNVSFDIWNLLGLLVGPFTDEGANFLNGRKTSGKKGEDIAQYAFGMAKDMLGKGFGGALEGKVIIQRSKTKKDYYFASIRLKVLSYFQVDAEVGVKRARDGKLKPDHIMASLDLDPAHGNPWKNYGLPEGQTEAGVAGNGIAIGPNTYLSAFRLTITDLADVITHDSSFPVLSAGVNITIPLEDPTGVTKTLAKDIKFSESVLGGLGTTFSNLAVKPGSKFRLLGTVDMTVRSSGFEVVGTLSLGAIKLLNQAYVKVQWVDPWYLKIKATIDVLDFHVLIGTGSLAVGKGELEGYFMVGVYVPKQVPMIGGMSLAKFEVGFNKEKIWGAATVLLILVPVTVSITYYWGKDIEFDIGVDEEAKFDNLDLSSLTYANKPKDDNLWYLIYTDEDTGEQRMMGMGGNLRYVASSPPTKRDRQEVVYRDLGGGVQFLEFRANEIGASDIIVTEHYNAETGVVDSWTHSIPVGKAKGDTPADALLQVESFDNSGTAPDLSVKIGGAEYPIVWGEASSGTQAGEPAPNTIYGVRQELEADGTTQHMAYLAISYDILKGLSEDATLELTSNQQIDTSLIRAAKTLQLDGVTVTPDAADANKITVTSNFKYAKEGDKLTFSLSEDNAMPEAGGSPDEETDAQKMPDSGILIYEGKLTAAEAAAGSATRVIDLTKCSTPLLDGIEAEQDVRQMMVSGTYYMRANLSSSQASQSVISETPIQLLDPLSPAYGEDMQVTLAPAGNGKFNVTFPKVENKDRNGQTIENMTYAVNFYQNGEEYGPFSGVFFDPAEENPNMAYDEASNSYTVTLGERYTTQNVQTDDEGNVIAQTESHTGLDTGKSYKASVRVANAVTVEGVSEPSYHFGLEAFSKEAELPEPTPPKLTVGGGNVQHVTEYVNADGSVDEVDYYELLTNAENPSVTITSDVDATLSVIANDTQEVETGVSLTAGTPHEIDLSQFGENGTICLDMTATNVSTKDTETTALYLTIDRVPPTLILDGTAEDVYGASYKNGVMTFSGQTSKGAVLRAYANGASEAISGESLFTFAEDGMTFTANIPVSQSEPQATIRITATDEAGNETAASLTMRNADYDVVRGISMSEIDNLSLPLDGSGNVTAQLQTSLVYHSGKTVTLEPEDVTYSVYLGNAVTLDADSGTVTAVRDGMSVIKAVYTAENGIKFEDMMTVRVLSETANAIRVVPPEKTAYVLGEELDLTGGQVVTVNEDGSDGETVALTADMVKGFDNATTGAQTIYVTYGGAQDSFQVTVSETADEWVLSGLSVTPPTKTRYLTGDSLNLDGAALTMAYALGGENKEETQALNELADAEISGFDSSATGPQIVTVTYQGKTAQFRVEVVQRELTSVKVETLPTKTMYLVGKDDLDLTGGKLTLFYNETDEAAETETLDLTDETVSVTGFDKTKVGSQTLTVAYADKSDAESLIVVVNDKTLNSIELKGTPKSEYLQSQALDVSGVSVTLLYDNDTQEDIPLTEAMVSGFDADTPGEQTLTVTYNGKTMEYAVTVKAQTLVSLELVSEPYKTKYEQDATLNLNGAALKLTYDNGVVKTLTPSGGQFDGSVTVSGYDKTQSGKQTVTLSVGDKSVTFDVEVSAKKLLSIAMEKLPAKLSYKYGEELDLTGGQISLYYDNDTKETLDLTASMVSGYNAFKAGVQTLTVLHGNGGVTFNVTVSDKTLSKITLSKVPDKLSYFTGDALDVTGGELTLVYEGGSEDGPIALTKAMVSGYDSQSAGVQTLTVTYNGVTTTYNVTVSAKALSAISVETPPDKTRYVQKRDELDLTGGKLTLTYNNGDTRTLDMTDSGVTSSGFDNAKSGDVKVTLSYEGKRTDFTVKIVTLKSVSVSALPNKTAYQAGESLNVSGGQVKLTYSDGATELLDMTEDMILGDLTLTGNPGAKTVRLSVSGVTAEFEVTLSKAADSADYELKVSQDGSYSVIVNDDSIPRGILVITKYDADGRMIAIRSEPIQLTKGKQIGVLDDLKDASANYTVSLLSISYISLCDKVEIINVTPN